MGKKIVRTRISFALALVLALGMVASALAAGDYTNPSFPDVPKSHWSYIYVEKAREKGWINGDDRGYFLPNDNVTYAQMCVMVVKAFFSDDFAAYTGSSSPWYAPYTSVAAQVGLLNGTSIEKDVLDAGKVNTPCSRMEMALIVYNAMSASGGKMPSSAEVEAAAMKTSDIAYYFPPYTKAIAATKAAGIINGVDDKGTFSGRENMTRAQAAVVMIKLDEYLGGTGSNTTNPGTTPETNPGTNPDPKPETPSTPAGGRDSNGNTLASGVKSTIGKSDSYPTKGRETSANRNGYYTAADVDIGEAQLGYELLDMVNEARRAEGLNELTWVPTDAMEEYTLLRAYELTSKWSHERPNDQYNGFMDEIIAGGGGSAKATFNAWMNSPGHKKAIMEEVITSMCAAKCGNCWIITFGGSGAPSLTEGGAPVNYEKYNGRIDI